MRDEHRLPLLQDFEAEVIRASHQQPVWLLFSADWCMPCRLLEPQLYRLMQQEDLRVYKCDVERDPDLAARFQVQGLPAVKCFRKGVCSGGFAGVVSAEKMRALLAQA